MAIKAKIEIAMSESNNRIVPSVENTKVLGFGDERRIIQPRYRANDNNPHDQDFLQPLTRQPTDDNKPSKMKLCLSIVTITIVATILAVGAVAVILLKGEVNKLEQNGSRWEEVLETLQNKSSQDTNKVISNLMNHNNELRSRWEEVLETLQNKSSKDTNKVISNLINHNNELKLKFTEIKEAQDESMRETNRVAQKLLELENKMYMLAQSDQPRDCTDFAQQGYTTNGIYRIVVNSKPIFVYCEFKGADNWLVFQRRDSGKVNFFLDWRAYKYGFGNKSGEFWLGLEDIHAITRNGSYKLRIDLEDWSNNTAYEEYSTFEIGNSTTNYRLSVRGFTGSAGDSLTFHNNLPFSTKDRDHDLVSGNCARSSRGAWWYKDCQRSNLNGIYAFGGKSDIVWRGVEWRSWKTGVSMKATKMKIERN